MNFTAPHDSVWEERSGATHLSDFFFAIRRNWMIGVSVWAACVCLALALAFLLPSWWRAEAVLMPASRNNTVNPAAALGGSLGSLAGLGALLGNPAAGQDEALAVLRSRALFDLYATRRNLLPILYADRWDAQAGRWAVTGASIPTLRRAYKLFDSEIRDTELDRRTGIITLSITWKDRRQAAQWAADLVALANQQLRARALADARRNMDYLGGEIRKDGAMSAQNALTTALSAAYDRELQNYMFAQGQPDYAFRVIDAPTVPDERERVWPGRVLFAIFGALAGAVLGLLAAWAVSRGKRR